MSRTQALSHVDDAVLATRAAAGENPAFAALYERHAETAFRVAYAVTGNREDAADAVSDAFTKVLQALGQGRLEESASIRAYLLTSTRRAGIDALRRRGRAEKGDVTGYAAASAGPTEKLLDKADAALVAAAFRGLPERWRSVLWLTEVEQIPAKEAAPLLGLSANGVAQLAVRARNGLRERYLQAHLRDGEVPEACRFSVERLGAYVAGALPPRDLAKVDQHLAGCEPCRSRHAELEDLGGRLRRIIIPLPIGLAGIAMKNWQFAGGFSPIGRVRQLAGALAGKAERPLAVMSATTLALGLAGLGMVGGAGGAGAGPGGAGGGSGAGRSGLGEVAAQAAPVVLHSVPAGLSSSPAENVSLERRSVGLRDDDSEQFGVPIEGDLSDDDLDSVAPDDDGPPDPPPPPPPPAPPKPVAQLQVTVSGGGATLSIAAGQGDGSCTGGTLGGQSAGPCNPPPPNSDALITVATGGQSVPAQEITLP